LPFLLNRDVYGGTAARDFLKNHRGNSRLFIIHRGSGSFSATMDISASETTIIETEEKGVTFTINA
jgi:hypothetical protein